jgi:predicted adenine nucleotide alpha hydrolase (AANH) superfamily ATPase
MSAYQYQLLKCEDCGKTLGYIYVKAKMSFSGMVATRVWNLQNQPPLEVEKTAFCETCFQKRLDETLKGQSETKNEKNKSTKPRSKPKDRPLIR